MSERVNIILSAHMIFQESIQALITIGNQKELAEVKDTLSQVGLLVGGNEDPLVWPQ